MIEDKIEKLALEFRSRLQTVTTDRVEEMKEDDNSHYLIYRVLGVSYSEGQAIDVYQNKGRFLYKYAGSLRIPNTLGSKPAKFEIDCLIGNDALEIKWKDATTDGDHITKEHTRIKVIAAAGYTPIRVMFYYPNRGQAIKIQETLQTLYSGIGGQYYHGDDAWSFVKKRTKVDLFKILEGIADKLDGGVQK